MGRPDEIEGLWAFEGLDPSVSFRLRLGAVDEMEKSELEEEGVGEG